MSKFIKTIKWLIKGETKKAKRIQLIIKLGFAIILFIALFWIIPFTDVLDALLKADLGYFIGGLGFSYLVLFLDAIKQNILTRKLGLSLNPFQLFSISLTIKFFTLFTPSALTGSSLRWYKMTTKEESPSSSFIVVVFNSFIDIFLLLIIGLVFLVYSDQAFVQINNWLLAVLLLVMTIGWIALPQLIQLFLFWVNYLKSKTKKQFWLNALQNIQKTLSKTSKYARFSATEILLILFVGIAINLIGLITYFFFAKSVGIELFLVDLGWIRSLIILTAMLPISFAGGLGVREVSLVTLLSFFDINAETALAFSLLLLVKGIIISLTGGVIEAVSVVHSKDA